MTTKVIGSGVCLFVLMDRVPRRTLIIGGFIATTTCHALIVLSALLLPEGLTKAFVILVDRQGNGFAIDFPRRGEQDA